MSQEIELKLALGRQGPLHLLNHPLLRSQAANEIRLANTYFDTADGALERARVALRIRETPDGRWQTLKTSGHGSGGLSIRGEWEWPINGPELDLDRLAELPPLRKFDRTVLASLAPRFSTDFLRRTWWLECDDARIELALDGGTITAAGRQADICEVELELKEGRSEPLWQLARRLADDVPLRPASASKAARGAALLAGHWPLPASMATAEACFERATLALDALADSHELHFKTKAHAALARLATLGDDQASVRQRELALTLANELTHDTWLSIVFGQTALALTGNIATFD